MSGIIDYLDHPPQRYAQPVIRTLPSPPFQTEPVPLLPHPKGTWVKFEDMDLYMFEGAQLMMELQRENERLRETIKHMCDNLCSPGDCQHPDCPRAAAGARDG